VMARFSWYTLGLLIGPAAAMAQSGVQPTAQGEVTLTIYSNIALVQDIRTVSLGQGVVRQEFPDVSAQIAAETVSLGGDGFTIMEQNFDYDLLSPEAMMRKAVGQVVTLVRTNPATGGEIRERAKVLAVNGGVVIQIADRIEVLRDDGLPVRVIFDSIPPNLRARPTLSVTMDSSRAGARPLTLSYLTKGLGWEADYVALFDETKGAIDMQGWITLSNSTGTTFTNAKLILASGAVGEIKAAAQQPSRGQATSSAGTEDDDGAEELGDFGIYRMPARTTVANAQTKQLSFLNSDGVGASRLYYHSQSGLYGSARVGVPVLSLIQFSTGKAVGVGKALPAGVVRVYMRDSKGEPKFIGESRIDQTNAGSKVDLPTGVAFDVKVQAVQEKRVEVQGTEWEKSARYRIKGKYGEESVVTVEVPEEFYRTSMRYILTNARSRPVSFKLEQAGLGGWTKGTRVTEESNKGEQINSDVRQWIVDVPANGKAEVTATFETSF
jgi:hypothetical protein